jgi:hypothetical protein
MTIEIHQPELEALILRRMESGGFQDVEEVLFHALRFSPPPETPANTDSKRTGADLMTVMQAMPYKDDIDIEPHRPYLVVRDVLI